MGNRDIVVIGASEGGVDAVLQVTSTIPADFPGAVFVVLHVGATLGSNFPELLTHRGRLRATHAIHGEEILPGRIYVAPPDNHLMLRPGYMQVVRGPKENGYRPAIDALFRTAATAYGSRVIGVVLTGNADCGTAGLLSIVARGGLAVVQDPREARVLDMPANAIRHVAVNHIVPLDQMAPLLGRLVGEPAPEPPTTIPRALMELEGSEPGIPSPFVCPLCDGAITETEMNGFQSFRCHVGHSFSLNAVAAEQADQVERALWAAIRALDEAAALSRKLADRSDGDLKQRFEEREDTQRRQARTLRELVLSGAVAPADVPALARQGG